MAPFKRYFPGKGKQDEPGSDSDSELSSQEGDPKSSSKAIRINVPERLHQADEVKEARLKNESLIGTTEAESARLSDSVTNAWQQFEGSVKKETAAERQPFQPAELPGALESQSEQSESQEQSVSQEYSEEDSEEDSESEEEVLLKPIFIKKGQYPESGTKITDGSEPKEKILVDIEHGIRNEKRKSGDSNEDDENLDDTDDLVPELEYQSWRKRELDRLKRDRDLLIAKEKEQEEVELQRNRDPKQVERELAEKIQREEKERLEKEAFMKEQKELGVYDNRHQGAFFHGENGGNSRKLAVTDEKDVGRLKRAKVDRLGTL